MSSYVPGQVNIANPVDVTVLNPGGSLAVSPLAGNALTNVPDTVLTTIVTYTAPSDKQVTQVTCSGTLYAKFQLFLNTVLMETRRGGPDRTVVFEFNNPLTLNSGDILDVKVEQYNVGQTADFDSTIYGA
jgi:hypothetical protein